MSEASPIDNGPESGKPEHEDALGKLVCSYMDRLIDGEKIAPEEILRDHPTLGPSILDELETFTEIGSDPEDEHAAPLGTLGDYTLRRQIGRGGMGVVYEAWQNSLDRQVALKVLPAGIAADNRAFIRFMREARTAARLNHQNVVSVYGMGVEQNTPYYSMELVKGETLAQVLARLRAARANEEDGRVG